MDSTLVATSFATFLTAVRSNSSRTTPGLDAVATPRASPSPPPPPAASPARAATTPPPRAALPPPPASALAALAALADSVGSARSAGGGSPSSSCATLPLSRTPSLSHSLGGAGEDDGGADDHCGGEEDGDEDEDEEEGSPHGHGHARGHGHVHAVHGRVGKKKAFMCATCGKTFGKKNHVARHVSAVHLNVRPYVCPMCAFPFQEKRGLARHLKVHEKQRDVGLPTAAAGHAYMHHLQQPHAVYHQRH
jgi:predicted RNA-binding Zn-ribbon protein involved in translation (DUF1610 family)